MAEEDKHSKGGQARAKSLTRERLTEIAKQGALARWGYKATHKGNFKEDFGINADCYILDDEQKTAVMSQSGMAALLGLARGGHILPRLIKQIAPYAGETGTRLLEKLANPIIFQWHGPAHGYDITDLIDVCNAVLLAESNGYKFTSNIVIQVHLIKTASEKSGIQNLAWRLAGYDPTREEVIKTFKEYVQAEACRYKSEFPHRLYEEWCRLYPGLRQTKIHNTFSYFEPKHIFKKLVLGQIYFPMDNSKGAVLELIKRARAEKPGGKRMFHYLTELVGLSALRRQIGKIEGILQLSDSKEEYEKNFAKVCGDTPLELKI